MKSTTSITLDIDEVFVDVRDEIASDVKIYGIRVRGLSPTRTIDVFIGHWKNAGVAESEAATLRQLLYELGAMK